MLVRVCEIDTKSQTAYVCMASDAEAYQNNEGSFYVKWFNSDTKNRAIAPKIGMTYTVSPSTFWEEIRGTMRIVHGRVCHPWPIDTIAKQEERRGNLVWVGRYNPHENKLAKSG